MQGDSPQPGRSNYLDFELEIDEGHGREYPVTVFESPAGDARATMHFPFDELALDLRLTKLQNALLRSGGKHRRVPSEEERAVQEFGQALFDALLNDDIRTCYDLGLREAARQGRGLRLKLRIRPPKLSALPWEFLYDPRQGEYICLSRRTPIVRYLESRQPVQPFAVTPPLRILGMVASPAELPSLDVERERQRVEQAVQELRARGLMELEWLPGQTWRDLQEATWGGPWHVFHFVGHGGFDANADEGFIALADSEGGTHRLSATLLGRLLADHSPLRLVLLNSCEGARGGERDVFSSTASILVRRGIPAVLAMQYEITDRAAIELARAFYRALAYGMAVDEAVVAARKAISLAVTNTVEWGTPVLYTRAAEGVLFQIGEGPPSERPPPGVPGTPPEVDPERELRLEQLYLDGLDAFWVGEWDKALRSFRAIVDQRPDYQDAAARLREAERQRDLAQLHAQAQSAQEAEDWPGTIAALEKLVAEEPDFKDAAALLETARKQVQLADLYAQAKKLHRAGRWQAVVNVFGQIATLEADYADPEGLLPAALRELEAEAELEEDSRRSAVAKLADQKRHLPGWAVAAVTGLAVVAVIVAVVLVRGGTTTTTPTPSNTLSFTPTSIPTTTSTQEPTPPSRVTVAPPPPTTGAPVPGPMPAAPITSTVWEWSHANAMVYVPAGTFWMGSDEGDPVAESHEKPLHEVYLDAFWIDRTEVTNVQYKNCVEDGECRPPSETRSNTRDSYYSASEFDNYPAIFVDWAQANAYCAWAGKRLPTEAEWEKAARGTEGRIYPWGEGIDCEYANYSGCVGDTAQVGSCPAGASPYGVLDMAGNVWEWTGSLYEPYPYDGADGREDPEVGGSRVQRGGSWYVDRGSVRAASRLDDGPTNAYDNVGFRCARSGDEPSPPGETPTPTATSTATRTPTPTPLPPEIVFAAVPTGKESEGGDFDIYVADNTGGQRTRLLNYETGVDEVWPIWLPDKKGIVYCRGLLEDCVGLVECSYLWRMHGDGSGRYLLHFGVNGRYPDISPDGKQLAFVSTEYGNMDIFVADLDGAHVAQLTNHQSDDAHPDWSPDGTQVVFDSMRNGDWEIYVVGIDGSNLKRLTMQTRDTDPSWSPDGRHIAFVSFRDGNGEIYVMNVDGSNQMNVSNNAAHDLDVGWTPDGRILFASARDGDFEIYVINRDGSGLVKLTDNAVDDRFPDWK